MKPYLRIILFCAVFCLVPSLASCYIPFYLPESGRWYCEELNMTLDFATYRVETESEEATADLRFHIDYGQQIIIYEKTEQGENDVMRGDFKCKDDIITVKTSNGKVYTFLLHETV